MFFLLGNRTRMGTTMSVHGHALGQSCATYMRDSLSLTHSNCFNLGNQCVGNVRKLVGPLLGKKSRWVGPKNRVRNPVQNPIALTGASPVRVVMVVRKLPQKGRRQRR